MLSVLYAFDRVSFRYKKKRIQISCATNWFVLWGRTDLFYNIVFFKFFKKSIELVSVMNWYFGMTLCNKMSIGFKSDTERSCNFANIVFMCCIACFVFYRLHSNRLQSVIYSVSVRSENWKLNLFLNLRFSVAYGNEGKSRGLGLRCEK